MCVGTHVDDSTCRHLIELRSLQRGTLGTKVHCTGPKTPREENVWSDRDLGGKEVVGEMGKGEKESLFSPPKDPDSLSLSLSLSHTHTHHHHSLLSSISSSSPFRMTAFHCSPSCPTEEQPIKGLLFNEEDGNARSLPFLPLLMRSRRHPHTPDCTSKASSAAG